MGYISNVLPNLIVSYKSQPLLLALGG